ncbi:MAG: type II secretion system protein [Dethiobacter sp.]|jgi:prepilin-type N-terminal cleavage/methylation domain-containing protein|nr:MAG: type II secretion system protein [Dethiobacter sp.]
MRKLTPEDGFTLIEIAVTIAILGLVMITFGSFFTGSYVNVFAAGRKTQALNLAQEKMEELKSRGYHSLGNEYLEDKENYSFAEEYPEFGETQGFRREFRLQRESLMIKGYEAAGIKVEVSVSYQSNRRSVSLTSFIKEGN